MNFPKNNDKKPINLISFTKENSSLNVFTICFEKN